MVIHNHTLIKIKSKIQATNVVNCTLKISELWILSSILEVISQSLSTRYFQYKPWDNVLKSSSSVHEADNSRFSAGQTLCLSFSPLHPPHLFILFFIWMLSLLSNPFFPWLWTAGEASKCVSGMAAYYSSAKRRHGNVRRSRLLLDFSAAYWFSSLRARLCGFSALSSSCISSRRTGVCGKDLALLRMHACYGSTSSSSPSPELKGLFCAQLFQTRYIFCNQSVYLLSLSMHLAVIGYSAWTQRDKKSECELHTAL